MTDMCEVNFNFQYELPLSKYESYCFADPGTEHLVRLVKNLRFPVIFLFGLGE